MVGRLGTTAVVATRAGSLVSACTGLGAGGVMVGSLVSTCTGLGAGGVMVGSLVSACTGPEAGGITVGTASVLPGTATEVLCVFTVSKTACTMLGTSWVIKGWVTGCSVEDWAAGVDWARGGG